MKKFKARLLSIGNNRKLGKNIAIFNLPQGDTCPGRTEVCRKICYAAKAERLYNSVRDMRIRNFDYIRKNGTDKFAADIINEIKQTRVKMVRIHESGDFYNQAYLDAWVSIAKAFPGVKFLSYTKSFMLDWTEALKLTNWSIIWSIDKATTLPVPTQGPTAYLLLKDEPAETVPAPAFTCIHKSAKHYCGTECKICWGTRSNGKVKRIYFSKH